MADTSSDELLVQSSYHYIGHFARFIKPGARRVLCAATRQDLECTAFVNPDASTVVVVMNRTEAAIRFGLSGLGDKMASTLPARSIATYLFSG